MASGGPAGAAKDAHFCLGVVALFKKLPLAPSAGFAQKMEFLAGGGAVIGLIGPGEVALAVAVDRHVF